MNPRIDPWGFLLYNILMESKVESFVKNHKLEAKGQNARSFIFDCPACGGSKKLYIERQSGRSVCFKSKSEKCPKQGSNAAYALSLLTGIPIGTVKRELHEFVTQLTDEINVSFEDDANLQEIELKSVGLPPDVTFIEEPASFDGVNYLEKRGIPLDMQSKYNVMYSPSMRRVIFPVIMHDKLCGWQGRAIDSVDHQYRMYNVPGNWKAHTLMFYENIINKDFAIIAEGPISALKFEKVGNFVASMGKNISNSQIKLLRKAAIKKVYLALDRDAVDKIEDIRYALNNEMDGRLECYTIPIPSNRDDFGDATFDECYEAFKMATKLDGDEIFVHLEGKLSGYSKKY